MTGPIPRGTRYNGLSDQFFRIFELRCVCFVVATCMSALVHDVEAVNGLC